MPALAGWRRSQTVPSAVELVPEETKGVKRVEEMHVVTMTPHWLSLASCGVVVPVSSPWLQVGDLM